MSDWHKSKIKQEISVRRRGKKRLEVSGPADIIQQLRTLNKIWHAHRKKRKRKK